MSRRPMRTWCGHCGSDLDNGRACSCREPRRCLFVGPPIPQEIFARRFLALTAAGVPEWQAGRLAPPDRVPS